MELLLQTLLVSLLYHSVASAKPGKPRIEIPSATQNVNAVVEIQCITASPNPSPAITQYHFFKSGTVDAIHSGSTRDYSLTTTAADIGTVLYTCEAENADGTSDKSDPQTLTVRPTKPTISRTPWAGKIQQNNLGVKVTCTSSDTGTKTFGFLKADDTVLRTSAAGAEYTLLAATTATLGELTVKCKVTINGIESDASDTTIMTIQSAQPEPELKYLPNPATDMGSVTWKCSSGATGVNNYKITKGGTVTPTTSEPEQTINPALISQAGDDLKCEALEDVTSKGTTTKTLKLKPKKPTLSSGHSGTTIAFGAEATLTCETASTASGLKYTFTFYKGGDEIFKSTDVLTSNSYNLKIPIRENTDYLCDVTVNGQTSDKSDTTSFTVTGTGTRCDHINCGLNAVTVEPCKINAQNLPECQCKPTHEGQWCTHAKTNPCNSRFTCDENNRDPSKGADGCVWDAGTATATCACKAGFFGRFCEKTAPVKDTGACRTSSDCAATVCTSASEVGYCEFPDFVCKCKSVDTGNGKSCTKHKNCHDECTTDHGLCKSGKCVCFIDDEQMMMYMLFNKYPN